MRLSGKGILLFTALFVPGVLILVLGPVATCGYKHYKFVRNIQVRIEIPSCVARPSGSTSCNYIFSFEGERDSHSVRFTGKGLRYEYDPGNVTFTVTGTGDMNHYGTAININSSEIAVNGQSLHAGEAPERILVKRDGSLVSGYCELRW